MENIRLNSYKNLASPTVDNTISIKKWFNSIKCSSFSSNILNARKYKKGDEVYEKVKRNIPCITPNFLFRDYKLNKNIISGTGILFFDIDNDEFKINTNITEKIMAYYLSFGGIGHSILVRVDGLSLNNFRDTYIEISKQLGISEFVDIDSRKASQFNVLTFDPNIYINENPYIFKAVEKKDTAPICKKAHKKKDTAPIYNINNITNIEEEEEEEIGDSVLFLKLKFKSELEYYSEDCVYIPEGREYVECKVPFNADGTIRKLTDGKKHSALSIYINNLLYLNPKMQQKQANEVLRGIVENCYDGDVPEKNTRAIVSALYKKFEEGKLLPVGAIQKKYWVNPNCNNKFEACVNKRGEPAKNALEAFFGDELCNINEKVDYKIIAEYIGMSKKTVNRRITNEFKQILKEHNDKFKKKV